MAKRRSYPLEFRQQMVELVRVGRKPGELASEFAVSEQAIRNWVKQAEVDAGQRADSLSTQEKEELQRLRRENKAVAHGAGDSGKSRGLVELRFPSGTARETDAVPPKSSRS